MQPPDYSGGGLVNLVAELERRLTGRSPAPGLHPELAAQIPDAASYVLVLYDGLGDHQLSHPAAGVLAASRAGALDAPFPTTTTVSLATIATGRPPAAHGLLGYQLWLPDVGQVVNTIKWTTVWGDPIPYDYDAFLPEPNTWERVAAAGIEPIVVQPFNFEGSPLTRVLYRGCRWEPWATPGEAADAAVQLAAEPGRLILVYLPHVDFAAHVAGQRSAQYTEAMEIAAATWRAITTRLPAGAVAVATADHGHVDIPPERRHRLAKADHENRVFSGDPRVMFVRGDGAPLAERLPAQWVSLAEMLPWWGPGVRHPSFDDRAPDGALVADPGHSLLHRFSDDRLVGQHGGLTAPEIRIPLLVSSGR